MTLYKVFFILQTFSEYSRLLSNMGVRNTDPLSSSKSVYNFIVWDVPGGTVDKNPRALAGDPGSIPGSGRNHRSQSNLAHVPQLLSLCSKAHEVQLLKLKCCNYWNLSAATTETPTPRACAPQEKPYTGMRSPCTAAKSSPPTPHHSITTRESPHVAMKTQLSQRKPQNCSLLCTCGSASSDSTKSRPCSTVVFSNEKHLSVSEPVQFKPMCSRVNCICHI